MNRDLLKKAYQGRKPGPVGKHRFYSVLIPFVEKKIVADDGSQASELYILYEVRAKDMGSDPGEVCFPGGRVEEGETHLECAIRETGEELGIDEKNIEIVGRGDTLYGYANYTISSYIGIISYETYEKIRIQEKEVDSVFLMKPEELKAMKPDWYEGDIVHEVPENFPYEKLGITRDYSWRTGKWQVPIYYRQGDIIWGLTARFTDGVLKTLFP
ncbi:MAG TPA: CoA pyrophosphatase [Anaerovoracaceae bacterium]|nr:CoA pyrophosphatase [Anaerovoracaceae bacterium]